MKLDNIAKVSIGLPLSRKKFDKEEDQQEFQYEQITLSCLDKDGYFFKENTQKYLANEELDKRYFTKVNDILVRLREPVSAYKITKNEAGLLVPTYFAIISLKSTENFLPEYITSCINSSYGQRYFARVILSNQISILKTRFLKEFEVKGLKTDRQMILSKIINLKTKEENLLRKLSEEKKKLYKVIENKIFEQGE